MNLPPGYDARLLAAAEATRIGLPACEGIARPMLRGRAPRRRLLGRSPARLASAAAALHAALTSAWPPAATTTARAERPGVPRRALAAGRGHRPPARRRRLGDADPPAFTRRRTPAAAA